MRNRKARISRQSLLKKSAAGAASIHLVSRHVLGGPGFTPPSEKLQIACVGAGGMGNKMVRLAKKFDLVSALCDVDQKRAAASLHHCPKAARFEDFREMFEKHQAIDAVMIATPDHTHYPIAKMAIEMGKHVYCQKPLTHNIQEARKLTELAQKVGVVTQMGNQGHATDGARSTVEWIQSGLIGEVHEVHTWTNRPSWPQGMDRPKDQPPIPKTLNWDLWLGPAKERPYHPTYLPFNWRAWWDFGTGALGDMGCHIIDHPVWALGLGAPTSVEARVTEAGYHLKRNGRKVFNHETFPYSSIVYYTFDQGPKKPNTKLIWYDGGLMPAKPVEMHAKEELPSNGVLYVGSKGKIVHGSHGGTPSLLPRSKMEGFKAPKASLPRLGYSSSSDAHYKEWVDAIRGGNPTLSGFDYSGPMTETVLLGNLALRANGKTLIWDSPSMKILNAPELNAFTGRLYRKGWSL